MPRDLRSLWLALPTAAVLFACHSQPNSYAQPPLSDPSPFQDLGSFRGQAAGQVKQTAAPAKATEERLIELGRTDNRVQEHLRHLCVEIGPRLTGSTRLQTACEWARETFASYGLTASLEKWGDFPVGFDRGPWSGGMVAPVELEFEFHTMAWTPGTDGAWRGPALAYPASEQELDALSDRLVGSWLVRPPSAGLKDAAGEVVFEKPEQPSVDLIRKVQALLVERGALGEVRGARGDLLVTSGDHEIEWNDLPELVQIRVRKDHHDQLWTRMHAGEAVELEFDIDNRFFQGPVPQYNVVADLRGKSKPDELVIVSGHLDSWDGAQGALDNATGCATTIEAARLLVEAGAEPERTIRFVLWTGEEQGLFGSEGYVRDHAAELPRISAVFVHDEGTNPLTGLGVPAAMMPAMRAACEPLFGLDPGIPFELEEVDGLTPFVGSDNDSFVRAGVPGLFWRQVGRSDYEHHHHTQHDTVDAAIPEYQEHSALVAALTAYGVANLPELLDRTNMKAPEPRRMGVQLDGTKIAEVLDGSRAEASGMHVGDVILAIDGEEVRMQGAITSAIRSGGPRKMIRIKRGEETLELTLDWSDDPDEPRRQELAKEREEREAAPPR
jgi:hypothetical protein